MQHILLCILQPPPRNRMQDVSLLLDAHSTEGSYDGRSVGRERENQEGDSVRKHRERSWYVENLPGIHNGKDSLNGGSNRMAGHIIGIAN